MEQINYLDFDLRISASSNQYRAEVLNSPYGGGAVDFILPFEVGELEDLRRKLQQMDLPELTTVQRVGEGLFQAVFQGVVRELLYKSLAEVDGLPQTGLRIKLRLQDASDLADLPWEFLFDPDAKRFLVQSVHTPVVRYLETRERIDPLQVTPPLRILGMVSNPSNYAELNVKNEQDRLEDALRPLLNTGLVEITWLSKATLSELRQALRVESYHVFHFIGHGGFNQQKKLGMLVLVDENGYGWPADASRLSVLLHDHHHSLRLAVLNTCEGALFMSADPFASVAGSLLRQGIPAVVAMQFKISDQAARVFAEDFYAALAQGYPVDAGLAEARKAIYCLPEDNAEWGTPVLYLRAPDGVLFNLTVAPARIQDPTPTPVVTQVVQDAPPIPVKKSIAKAKPKSKKLAPIITQTKTSDPLAEYAIFIHIPKRNFWIAKYPVTNGLYQRFLESSEFAEREFWVNFPKIGEPPAYQELGYWGENGWKWLQSNLNTGDVVYPRHWKDDHFGILQEKAPVVSITWYEANAYCKWLFKHWATLAEGRQNPTLTPTVVRLPTEFEWAFAAGENKPDEPSERYPWDTPGKVTSDTQDIVQHRANVKQSQIEHTTAVDAYPQGTSQPYGLFDLAGNVWEWQANYFDKDHNVLALRGGSWHSTHSSIRVANRNLYHPGSAWRLGGYRVLVIPR